MDIIVFVADWLLFWDKKCGTTNHPVAPHDIPMAAINCVPLKMCLRWRVITLNGTCNLVIYVVNWIRRVSGDDCEMVSL